MPDYRSISRLLLIAAVFLLAGSCKKKYPDGPLFSLSSKYKRVVTDWRLSSAVVNGTDKSDYPGFATCWLSIKEHNEYSVKWEERGKELNTIGQWNWADGKRSISFSCDLWFYKFESYNQLTGNTFNNSLSSTIVYRITKLTGRELWMHSTNEFGSLIELRFDAVTKQR